MTTNPFTIATKAVKVLESSQTLEQHMTAQRYHLLAIKALRQSLDSYDNQQDRPGLWALLAGDMRQAMDTAQAKFAPNSGV